MSFGGGALAAVDLDVLDDHGLDGLSPRPVGVVSIASTTSREAWSATSPKIVCLKFSHGVAPTVMKNCEPLVPGPALAMASR